MPEYDPILDWMKDRIVRHAEHDQRCADLAEHFLVNQPKLKNRVNALAEHIQWTIENWIDTEKTLLGDPDFREI